jgi:DNA polymerase-3 subunit epsilon
MREIVLDTETTGLEVSAGHRLIEIGCVEIQNRRVSERNFHVYLQPDREVDEAALAVHGISNEDLAGKPRFADVAAEFLDFVSGARLIIHNAPFDLGFLDNELKLAKLKPPALDQICTVLDTLAMARRMHPGQRASLDALCKRYGVSNSHREFHGALLDAELLAGVYLAMTSGQVALSLDGVESDHTSLGNGIGEQTIRQLDSNRPRLEVIAPTPEELKDHEAFLQLLDKNVDGGCLWRQLEPDRHSD